ncbi:transmembrane protein 272-like isoform X2 [Nelusetta ayraudi]|uniref:transmembrane protein 272-like isoform X2 n=1 Tax=Nelusetta ayraudi TaxID=303726 RepID=UPI003F72CBED
MPSHCNSEHSWEISSARFTTQNQDNRTPRPHCLVASAVLHCVLNVSRLYFGVSYFKDCPQQPNIPNYLLGLVLISLLTHPLFTTAFGRRSRHPPQPPSCFKSCLKCLLSLVGITWLLAGDVWVFSVYQPNYAPAAVSGRYCNKNLYMFAFWNAAFETWGIFYFVTCTLKVRLCYVWMNPAPAATAFQMNV